MQSYSKSSVYPLQEKGRSPAYIKTELSAIRFFHDQIPNTRHKLLDNSDLSLQRRRFGQTDRTWSGREFNLFVAKAMELGREDYAAIFCLARYAALAYNRGLADGRTVLNGRRLQSAG